MNRIGIVLYSFFCLTCIATSLLRTNFINIRSKTDKHLNGSINYGGLNHCGVLVTDAEKSKEFYLDVFGCVDVSEKRNLPYPGAFLAFGPNEIHLMQLPNLDRTQGRPEHGGRDRHIAFSINNIDVIIDRLVSRSIPYTMSKSGRRALFCRDIDGNAFEFVEDLTLN